jgi:hypothetical protein
MTTIRLEDQFGRPGLGIANALPAAHLDLCDHRISLPAPRWISLPAL